MTTNGKHAVDPEVVRRIADDVGAVFGTFVAGNERVFGYIFLERELEQFADRVAEVLAAERKASDEAL